MNDEFKWSCGGIVFFFVAMMLCFTCCVGCSMVGSGIEYGEGFREGELQKFSNKGFMWKTWEGELAVNGIKTKGDNISNVFEFSVEDPTVVEQLNHLKHPRVKLTYKEYMGTLPWKGSTHYRIVKVEQLP